MKKALFFILYISIFYSFLNFLTLIIKQKEQKNEWNVVGSVDVISDFNDLNEDDPSLNYSVFCAYSFNNLLFNDLNFISVFTITPSFEKNKDCLNHIVNRCKKENKYAKITKEIYYQDWKIKQRKDLYDVIFNLKFICE